MSANANATDSGGVDPDGAPDLTDDILDIAETRIGDAVIRAATGYLGPNGVVRGRPPARGRAERQVTLRLDPDMIERFRAEGPEKAGG